MWGQLKLELRHFFYSPSLYLISALFSFLAGLQFFALLWVYIRDTQLHMSSLSSSEQVATIANQLIFPLMGTLNFILMLVVPALAMNVVAQEYQQKTFVLQLWSTLNLFKWISAKFFALVVVLLFLLSTLFFYPILFWYSGIYEYGFLFSGALALFLNALFFSALSLWASAAVGHSILALFLSYGILLLITVLGIPAHQWDSMSVGAAVEYLSLGQHFEQILMGEFALSSLGYYVFMILFFLVLSSWQLKWKQVNLP
jgi:ABC-2 type transport system permease protein